MRVVHRSALLNAPYNPRKIGDKAKARLRKNLETVGMMGPITWNERTGNIVSGHQRIDAQDKVEGTADYSVTVAVVDLDEKTEREQNVFMNNPEAQGFFDMPALEKVMAEIDVTNAGFDVADSYKMFGSAPLATDPDKLVEFADKIKQAQSLMDKTVEVQENAAESDYYCVLVFATDDERGKFLYGIGQDQNRYLDGRALRTHMEANGVVFKQPPLKPVEESGQGDEQGI